MTSTPSSPNPPKAAAPAALETDQEPHPATAQAPEIKRYIRRRWVWLLVGLLVLTVLGYYFIPFVVRAFTTISTDDAYVNGHVTLVAPRVPGKVLEVLVDDNYRVKKGELLVRIDPEPFQVLVALKRAAVEVAAGDLVAAESQARGLEALARSQRWKIQNYDPDITTLFVGLSATPYVYYREPPAGPNAGKVLHPFAPVPHDPKEPKP